MFLGFLFSSLKIFEQKFTTNERKHFRNWTETFQKKKNQLPWKWERVICACDRLTLKVQTLAKSYDDWFVSLYDVVVICGPRSAMVWNYNTHKHNTQRCNTLRVSCIGVRYLCLASLWTHSKMYVRHVAGWVGCSYSGVVIQIWIMRVYTAQWRICWQQQNERSYNEQFERTTKKNVIAAVYGGNRNVSQNKPMKSKWMYEKCGGMETKMNRDREEGRQRESEERE